MEYKQAAFNKGEVHAPFLTLFQKHRQLFEQGWLDESPRRFNTDAQPVHIVVHNKESGLLIATRPCLSRFFVTVEDGHLPGRSNGTVGRQDIYDRISKGVELFPVCSRLENGQSSRENSITGIEKACSARDCCWLILHSLTWGHDF